MKCAQQLRRVVSRSSNSSDWRNVVLRECDWMVKGNSLSDWGICYKVFSFIQSAMERCWPITLTFPYLCKQGISWMCFWSSGGIVANRRAMERMRLSCVTRVMFWYVVSASYGLRLWVPESTMNLCVRAICMVVKRKMYTVMCSVRRHEFAMCAFNDAFEETYWERIRRELRSSGRVIGWNCSMQSLGVHGTRTAFHAHLME